jgi:hypothetical protein
LICLGWIDWFRLGLEEPLSLNFFSKICIQIKENGPLWKDIKKMNKIIFLMIKDAKSE